jgi:phosphatidylglycerophosphatase A
VRIARPGVRFAFGHPAHVVALGFGVGLAPFAPGTFGTLLAVPIWWLMGSQVAPLEFFYALAFFFLAGIWACGVTGRHLGAADHGAMVWDEVVAFLLVLALIPNEPIWQVAAFVVFRAFDVVKPPPIKQFERRLAGGLGVMFDDLLAAGYTLVVLALAKRLLA